MGNRKDKLDEEKLRIICDALESHMNVLKKCVYDAMDADWIAYYSEIISKTNEIREFIKDKIEKMQEEKDNVGAKIKQR